MASRGCRSQGRSLVAVVAVEMGEEASEERAWEGLEEGLGWEGLEAMEEEAEQWQQRALEQETERVREQGQALKTVLAWELKSQRVSTAWRDAAKTYFHPDTDLLPCSCTPQPQIGGLQATWGQDEVGRRRYGCASVGLPSACVAFDLVSTGEETADELRVGVEFGAAGVVDGTSDADGRVPDDLGVVSADRTAGRRVVVVVCFLSDPSLDSVA